MDKFLLTDKKAVELSKCLINNEFIDKDTALSNAKIGFIPSGFDYINDKIRLSWIKNSNVSKRLLRYLLYEENNKGKSFIFKRNKK